MDPSAPVNQAMTLPSIIHPRIHCSQPPHLGRNSNAILIVDIDSFEQDGQHRISGQSPDTGEQRPVRRKHM